MPGMYNHCDQGYSSGTTVCAVERNNKKLKPKAKAPKMPSLFCFCSAHLKPDKDEEQKDKTYVEINVRYMMRWKKL